MRHHLMEEPYAVIPHVRICAGYLAGNAEKCGQCAEIYGDPNAIRLTSTMFIGIIRGALPF